MTANELGFALLLNIVGGAIGGVFVYWRTKHHEVVDDVKWQVQQVVHALRVAKYATEMQRIRTCDYDRVGDVINLYGPWPVSDDFWPSERARLIDACDAIFRYRNNSMLDESTLDAIQGSGGLIELCRDAIKRFDLIKNQYHGARAHLRVWDEWLDSMKSTRLDQPPKNRPLLTMEQYLEKFNYLKSISHADVIIDRFQAVLNSI